MQGVNNASADSTSIFTRCFARRETCSRSRPSAASVTTNYERRRQRRPEGVAHFTSFIPMLGGFLIVAVRVWRIAPSNSIFRPSRACSFAVTDRLRQERRTGQAPVPLRNVPSATCSTFTTNPWRGLSRCKLMHDRGSMLRIIYTTAQCIAKCYPSHPSRPTAPPGPGESLKPHRNVSETPPLGKPLWKGGYSLLREPSQLVACASGFRCVALSSIIHTRIRRELDLKSCLPIDLDAVENRFKWPFLKACESSLDCLLSKAEPLEDCGLKIVR